MSTAVQEDTGFTIPDHVPPALVRRVDLFALLNDANEQIWSRIADLHSEVPPIFWAERFGMLPGMWVVTRAADLRRVMQDHETFSSRDLTVYSKLLGETWRQVPLEVDPPEHSKYRTLVNPLFSPKTIVRLEESVRETAVRLIEGFRQDGRCDFVEEFSKVFPIEIFLRMMGWPVEEAPTFVRWVNGLLKASTAEAAIDPLRSIICYLRDQIALRRKNPSDDFTSRVTAMEVDGKPLSEDDVLGMIFLIFIGGLDTVTSSLGHQYHYLAINPDKQAWLREDLARIPLALEELLRARSVVTTRRLVLKDVELAGAPMKAGDHLLCPTAFANLDPAVYDDPLTVKLDREDNVHMAFAFGPHRCLGSHLARREMQIALQEWLTRVPEFRVAADSHPTIMMGPVIGISDLKLDWAA